ncbi:MAG: hypothetical protein OD814_001808, partial [Candidatus Alkanophagales archaeon MCA70_species_1]|nr:hypothetical protein [Candidatus Alkanophaga volatiphilum]
NKENKKIDTYTHPHRITHTFYYPLLGSVTQKSLNRGVAILALMPPKATPQRGSRKATPQKGGRFLAYLNLFLSVLSVG